MFISIQLHFQIFFYQHSALGFVYHCLREIIKLRQNPKQLFASILSSVTHLFKVNSKIWYPTISFKFIPYKIIDCMPNKQHKLQKKRKISQQFVSQL